MRRVLLTLMLAVALGVPSVASAATITPTAGFFTDDFTNNASCSLREALEVANDNASGGPEDSCGISGTLGDDTVQLEAGAYVLNLAAAEAGNATQDLDVSTTGPTTIDGAGAASTTIDTDHPSWSTGVIDITGFATATISDLTVTGGNNQENSGGLDGGGGIKSSVSTNLTLDRVRVTQNTAVSQGGGVLFAGSSLVVNDSEFSLNSSGNGGVVDAGGGGLSLSGTTTIDDSVVSDNTTSRSNNARGGGIFLNAAALTMTDTLVEGNFATDTTTGIPAGGGLKVEGVGSSATIRRSTFSGNQVTGGTTSTGAIAQNGAGINLVQASLTLVNSTVSGNEADGPGGFGAGLRTNSSNATIVSSTFAGNTIDSSTETGSAIYNGTASTVTVRGSILETSGTAAACGGATAITSADDNVFTDTSCGPEPGAGGNDDADADPMLGALADEGGPHVGAPGFLVPLLTQSPALASTAIDHVPAGDCNDAPSGTLANDERGFPRPFDSDGNATADCEAGATEVFPCQGQAANRVGTSGVETLTGTAGDDTIVGLGGNDTLIGLAGNDRLCGNDGDDTLRGGANNDQLDGGSNTAPIAGGDFANFSDSASGVTADISLNSASGDGTDTLVAGTIENLQGSPQGDNLIGDAGPNLIGGGNGTDVLNGLGGDDGLDGQVGTQDEVQFTGAPGAVTATLQDSPTQGSATGFGTDILFGLENVEGTPFGDTLTGNSSANVLRGLAGGDILTGNGAADVLLLGADNDTANAQDGVTDTIDCTGGGTDTGTFDTTPAETYNSCDSDGDAVVDFFDACPTQFGTLANGCPAPAVAPPPAATPAPATATPTTPVKKCKKGQKLKKGKCVKKKRKK